MAKHLGGRAPARTVSSDVLRRAAASIEPLERRTLLSLSPVGPEIPVNSFTVGVQKSPAVAVDGDGDIVVVWQSSGQDGSFYGVYAQRYNASGAAQGSEFRVNTYTSSQQEAPAVATDGDGDFVIVWQSHAQDGSGPGIYAQRYNAAGAAQGREFRVNSITNGAQLNASVAMDASGNFVVAWQTTIPPGNLQDIRAQCFDAAGVPRGAEFTVNTHTAGEQFLPVVAMDADGDFVVAWQSDGQDGDGLGIYAQRFDASGAPQGGEFRANSYTTNEQSEPAVAMDFDGDFVIAWQSVGQSGAYSLHDVYARRYTAAGVPLSAEEFRANTFTSSVQAFPTVAMDADGDFLVAWTTNGQDGSGSGIFARSFDVAGIPLAGEFQVNSFTTSVQQSPSVAMTHAGDVVAAWESAAQDGDGYGIYAQRFDEAPDTAGPIVAGLFINGREAQPHTVQAAPVAQVVLSFSENVSTSGGSIGANSVTNPANWKLVHFNNGSFADVPVANVSYLFNVAANRFEATLQVAGSFSMGNLQVLARDNIRDTAGNALDGDRDGVAGGSATVAFSIGSFAAHGPEFRVNSLTTGFQHSSAAAIDAHGNFMVAWVSRDQDGDIEGIYAQRYDSAGDPRGVEFRVNNYTTNQQTAPAVAMNPPGSSVIVWHGEGGGDISGIFAQRYNSLGQVTGSQFRVNTHTTNSQAQPSVAIDEDGDFLVAWESNGQDGSSWGIYAQRYGADGTSQGPEFKVNTFITGAQRAPSVAMDAGGGFVITWESSNQDGSGYGVYAQRYNAAGAPLGIEFRVNTHTVGQQRSPAVAMSVEGDFAVAWTSFAQDGSSYGIYAQRFSAVGVPQGPEFNVNTYFTSEQQAPSIAMSDDGDFVVTWESGQQDGAEYGVYAKRYDAAGVPRGPEVRVNTFTPSSQRRPSVAMDDDGDFVVAWTDYVQDGDDRGIYAQRFDLGMAPDIAQLSDVPDPVLIDDSITLSAIGAGDDGSVASVWFYRESNDIAGLQFGSGGDTLLGIDINDADGFAIAASTIGLTAGTHVYHAQAVDDEGFAGAAASATNTVISPSGPSVTAAGFLFETAPHKLTFTFDRDVSASLSLADIMLVKIGGGAVPSLSMLPYGTDGPNVASFTTTSTLPDGDFRATLVGSGITDPNSGVPMSDDYEFDVFFLAGDANRDRTVNLADFNILAANFGQTDRTFSEADFNYDGVVNLADFNILAGRFGTGLGPAATGRSFSSASIVGGASREVEKVEEEEPIESLASH